MKNEVIELHRQAKILSISMNALKAFTWYCDLRDGILRFGEGHEKMGIIPSEVDSLLKFGNKIHPKDRDRYIHQIGELCKQDSGEFIIEYEIDFNDSGKYEWWECRGSIEIVNDGDLSYKYVYGLDINIDNHKKSELNILQNKIELDILNRNNELILNNINSGLAFLNSDYFVEWENITTYLPNHPLTKNYRKGYCCYRSVKGLEEPCPNCVVKKSVLSGKIETKEVMDEQNRIAEITATPIFDEKNNQRIGTVLKVIDITEQKNIRRELEIAKNQAEKTIHVLRNIIDCLPCLLFIKDVDDDYKHIIVNKYFCQVVGRPENEVIGKTDYELFASKEFADRCRYNDEMIAAGDKPHTYEEETWFEGKHITWQSTKLAVTTTDGRRIIIAVASNITEKIKAYKELHEAKKKADESSRLKSAFLANMSHEIRTPLNSIVGFSELMMKTVSESDKKEYYNIIKNNNELLLKLIGDILDLSKIEAGMIEFKNEKFDVSELFRELYLNFKQRLSNSRVRLVVENPYESCVVALDRNRVSQVITNFLTNAIKFTPSGEIKMGYGYTDGVLKIYVSDTGIGIAEDKLGKVFERFEKLDDFAQGTGLGMAISEAIVTALGGKIEVESELGKGSVFRVSLPIEASISNKLFAEENLPLNAPITPKVTKDGLPEKNILVAEDNDSNYLLLQHMLKGHHLVRACNGVEAVEAAKKDKYDIILMDMKMPLMDGIGATKSIREFDAETPIIGVTAHAFSTDKEIALAAGCNDYITKPILKDVLFKVIRDFA